MSNAVKRLNPVSEVRRRLFALSSNRCAFPTCETPAISETGRLLVEICHIEAANKEGERFNEHQNNEQRRAFENLILLCGTHHTVTNDQAIYTTPVMKQMKAEHEARAYSHTPLSIESARRFMDATANPQFELPANYLELDLNGWDERSFIEAKRVLEQIATLPLLTRSLYTIALIYAVPGDLSLFVNPDELSIRLNVPITELDPHFEILSRNRLVTEWSQKDAELAGRTFKSRHFYLRGLDNDDYGLYFLTLMKRRFEATPPILHDIIENLNFIRLDV